MKKLFTLLFASGFALAMIACGGSSTEATEDETMDMMEEEAPMMDEAPMEESDSTVMDEE